MIKNVFHRAVASLDRLCDVLLGITMLALFVILMLQIFSRFVMFVQIPWSQDMITFLLVCTVFLGVGSATGAGKQIRLEFFADLFPKRINAVIFCLADCISIVFLVMIAKAALKLAKDNLTVHMGASIVPFGWYYAFVAFGCAVMILNFLDLILSRTDVIAGREKKEENR